MNEQCDYPLCCDHRLVSLVGDRSDRLRTGLGRIKCAFGEPQHSTHHHNREAVAIRVKKTDRQRRSGSFSRAKKVVAALRISIVRCWSATSLRNALISASSSVVGPTTRPRSIRHLNHPPPQCLRCRIRYKDLFTSDIH